MKYDFDEHIDRSHSNALKWMELERHWGRTDLLPLWVADMDFRTPDFIIETLHRRLTHEVLGYTSPHDGYFDAIIDWNREQYGLSIRRENINYVPGVVAGIYLAMQALTEKGDRILIQQPVYHPFAFVPRASERVIVNSPLRQTAEGFEMDLDDLRRRLPGCKLMVLCNPHNPGGIVWSPEVLREVAEIAAANQVTVVSDEIHCDMLLDGRRHVPFASVSDTARRISITLQSPTKSFNMPGIVAAHALVFDDQLRRRYFSYVEQSDMDLGNVFAFIAVEAAYRHGRDWKAQMLDYVQQNIDYVDAFLQEHIPAIRAIRPQASFLVFLDCRGLGFDTQEELEEFFAGKAHLALNSGTLFGPGGKGFMRLNVGTPRHVLEQALQQLQAAYERR